MPHDLPALWKHINVRGTDRDVTFFYSKNIRGLHDPERSIVNLSAYLKQLRMHQITLIDYDVIGSRALMASRFNYPSWSRNETEDLTATKHVLVYAATQFEWKAA